MSWFEDIKERVVWYANLVNKHADEKDINRNHVNYGITIAYESILSSMGHSVDVPVWEDDET